jgi:hypothetical protein
MSERALLGVWPAGAALKTVMARGGVESESLPGVVLDYGWESGGEGEFAALVGAWCGALWGRGIDTLVIYSSPASPGAELLAGLTGETRAFFMWTPGIHPPADAARRGLYTDAIYF